MAVASVDELRQRIRRQSKLKGRQTDDASLEEVRGLIGPTPVESHRRDLLIEHLHRLNDAFGVLRDRHLVALSREMNIPMAEVFEVATYYHHFDATTRRRDDAAYRVQGGYALAAAVASGREEAERIPQVMEASGLRANAGRQLPVERPQCGLCAPTAVATRRSRAAMRLLLLRVREERTFPPLILHPGDSVNQDVKCFSVGQRLR